MAEVKYDSLGLPIVQDVRLLQTNQNLSELLFFPQIMNGPRPPKNAPPGQAGRGAMGVLPTMTAQLNPAQLALLGISAPPVPEIQQPPTGVPAMSTDYSDLFGPPKKTESADISERPRKPNGQFVKQKQQQKQKKKSTVTNDTPQNLSDRVSPFCNPHWPEVDLGNGETGRLIEPEVLQEAWQRQADQDRFRNALSQIPSPKPFPLIPQLVALLSIYMPPEDFDSNPIIREARKIW